MTRKTALLTVERIQRDQAERIAAMFEGAGTMWREAAGSGQS